MRRILSLVALAGMFTTLALAEDFSGKLLDANCVSQQKKAASCNASPSTTAFALEESSGMVYKLDQTGNTKAAEALKSRAERSNPNQPPPAASEITAKVSGTQKNGMIQVQSIEVQ